MMENKPRRKSLKTRKPRKVIQPKLATEEKIVENQEIATKNDDSKLVETIAAATGQSVENVNAEIEAKVEENRINERFPAKSAARKERVPLGRTRLKMTASKRPGFHRHWINDTGGRLEQAEAGGYQFVRDDGDKIGETAIGSGNQDLGSRVSRIVGTMPDGKPQRAYLMEIEEELYQSDQKEKQSRLDLIDAQIKGGTYNPDSDTDTNRYVPSEGISIK